MDWLSPSQSLTVRWRVEAAAEGGCQLICLLSFWSFCNYPHLTWPSRAFPCLPFPSLGHNRTFGPVLSLFFLMPVCTLVVDIWLRRKAEHSANSVIIQCCGTERCNSQSPLAHRSNCVIHSSTGVIAHRHTPADARHSEASFLCLFLYLGTHKDDPRVQTLIFSEAFVGRGGKRVKSSTGGCTQMFCLVVRILRYKSVRVVGFSRDPNWNSLVQSEITFAGQTVSWENGGKTLQWFTLSVVV